MWIVDILSQQSFYFSSGSSALSLLCKSLMKLDDGPGQQPNCMGHKETFPEVDGCLGS